MYEIWYHDQFLFSTDDWTEAAFMAEEGCQIRDYSA